VLDRLMQKAAMRLRKQQLYASALTVHVRAKPPGAEHHQHADDHTRFSQTQDTVFLLHTLHTLWHRGLYRIAHPKTVGIVLHELVPAHLHTPGLFDEAPTPPSTGALQRAHPPHPKQPPTELLKALDQLNQKYGKNTLYFASSHHAREHAPMRIAFTRIPDVGTEG
jgi:DNA polymerase IV